MRPEPTDAGAAETEGWWPGQPPDPQEPFNSARRWAGRLAFPLLALGIVMAWRGIQVSGGGVTSTLPKWAWWMLAAVSVLAGLGMLRVRHRAT